MANKVKYGLRNVHYAVITNTAGVITYGTPVAIPGAVNLSLDAKGDKVEFYADDSLYFGTEANNGYEGDLEIALIPDAFKTAVLKFKTGASGALFEDANALPVPFALLFEFNGDVERTRHAMYNVLAGRPKVESSTKGESIDVKTDVLSLVAAPALDSGIVKGSFKPADTNYATFFTTVQVYAAPA